MWCIVVVLALLTNHEQHNARFFTKRRHAQLCTRRSKQSHMQGQHQLSSSSTCPLCIELARASQMKHPTKLIGPPSVTHFATPTTQQDQWLLHDEPLTPLKREVPLHPWIPPGSTTAFNLALKLANSELPVLLMTSMYQLAPTSSSDGLA